jgi:hypothetical protein
MASDSERIELEKRIQRTAREIVKQYEAKKAAEQKKGKC